MHVFRRAIAPLALPFLALAMPEAAHAQVPLPPALNPEAINAETLRRQQELQRREQRPEEPSVTVEKPAEAAPADLSGVRFRLNQVQFGPSAYLSSEELDALAAPYLGKDVGIADLQALVAAINRRYEALGVATARATLPAQTVKDGIVRIALVEGRVGETRVEGGSEAGRAGAERLVGFQEGALADVGDIEAALLRFNRTNDAQLRATLVPGTGFGTTDILLSLTEPKRTTVDFFLDNNGFETTGLWQGGGIIRVHRLLSAGDRLTGSFILSDGVRTGALAYSVPVGDGGTRLGLSYAHGETRVTRGALSEFGISGSSDTVGANLATLIWSGTRTSVSGTVGGQWTRARSRVEDVEIGDTTVFSGDTGLSLSTASERSQFVLNPVFSIARADERILDIERTVALFRGNLFAEHYFGTKLRVRARADWQLTPADDLPGVLQYQVGGTASSRGFAPGIAGGDRGYSFGVETGFIIATSRLLLVPYAFYDQAGVRSANPFVLLRSAGGGVSAEVGRRLSLDAYAAVPLTEPFPDTGGVRGIVAATFRF
jgi:hemolysin activation/secretion protein